MTEKGWGLTPPARVGATCEGVGSESSRPRPRPAAEFGAAVATHCPRSRALKLKGPVQVGLYPWRCNALPAK